jgi:hypothetical protein
MTSKTFIRDFYGIIIGSIEEDVGKHEQIARDFYGRILGTYDTKLNVTRDFYGRIVAQGNMLTGLIYEAKAKEDAQKEKNKR